MPVHPLTCSERRQQAQEQRKAALATLEGSALQSELDKADAAIKRADEREDCI